jgi:P27 family predicted phage terminase small subunit
MSENIEIIAELPEPPAYLNDIAKKEWFRAGALLVEQGKIAKNDMAVFAAYCSTYADYVYAEEEISKLQNRTVLTSQGSTLHPMVRYTRECKSQMLVYAKELGLSPRARNKMGAKKQKPDSKKPTLKNFMGGRKIA